MQRLQNKGLKMALARDIRYSTNELHKEAGLASWEVRSRIALTRLMFKYKYSEDYVDLTLSNMMTRMQSGPLFKLEKPQTDKFKNSVSYLGRKEWNELPAYIRCTDSYQSLKRAVKVLFNHRYFSSISA